MRGGKKEHLRQIAYHNRYTIARLYLKGKSQTEMAKAINRSQNFVSEQIQLLRQQWIRSAEIDFNEAQGAMLNKIDDMELEAIRQYKKSKRAKVITTTKKEPVLIPDTENPEVDDDGNIVSPTRTEFHVVEQKIRKEEGTGDIRWHDQIMKCIDMRIKVMGLYNQKYKELDDSASKLIGTGIAEETTKGKVALFLALIKEWDNSSSSN